jgi:serine phosphatase RsbU (regulator of sigma subunit)
VLRFSVSKELETVKHGMDIAIISIDASLNELQYAGARNSLYLIRDQQLLEIKADKFSTGIVQKDHTQVNYSNHKYNLQKGDLLYLFSDGFPDQKGGQEKKKFYYQPFKDLLTRISIFPVEEQQQRLNTAVTAWMGECEQTDDILVMGIRYDKFA